MKKERMYINKKFIEEISVADSFWTRFRGLMFKDKEQIAQLKGLLIKPCSQIHTFFMKEPIDVVYVDKKGNVLKADQRVMPGRCYKKVKKTKYVVELPEQSIERWEISLGDILEVR